MTKGKKLGIWMDHASAHLMEFTVDAMETKVVASKFTHEVKEHSISKLSTTSNWAKQSEIMMK
jgi:hypothetical protein